MKKLNLKFVSFAILFATILMTTTSFAQRGNGNGNGNGNRGECNGISDLTEQQSKQLQTLRTAQAQDMLTYRNQLGEKRARLRTLQTAENPDMKAINTTIEEMGAIKITKNKKRAAHKQEVRKILTPEQRTQFDMRNGNRGHKGHRGNGMRNGNGENNGQGYGNQRGNGNGQGNGRNANN